jgi:exosortase D (VPLPA-CTERM-specific)
MKSKFVPLVQVSLAAIIVIILISFYWPDLVNLAEQLTNSEDYSFGLLLPVVSGYIVYLKWPQIHSQPWRPSWWGLVAIILGFILYLLGDMVAVVYLSPFSFLVVLTGLVLLLGGWGIVGLLSFPLFLLFFMIPLPSVVMKNLTLPLQLISSWIAAGLLRAVGIPVVRQGNIIDLGVRQLQVVAACSGLRYILSLTALGMIFCYFYQRRLWKIAVLLISIIPAAILANALRVAGMGFYPALQEGFLHSFSGWLIFIFCFGFLALINKTLNLLEPQTPPASTKEIPPEERVPDDSKKSSHTPYLISALAVVVMASHLAPRISNAPPVHLRQPFDSFPMQIGPWQGQRIYLDQAMAKIVGADDYVEANYVNPQQGQVSLWIAFFQNQNKKIEGRIHSPLLCLTGSGWSVVESRILELQPGKPVRYLLMEQSGSRMVVYYWYLQRGRWMASEYSTKFFMGLDGMIKHRNDGAIIRLITPATPDLATARQSLSSFGQLLVPILPEYIPK